MRSGVSHVIEYRLWLGDWAPTVAQFDAAIDYFDNNPGKLKFQNAAYKGKIDYEFNGEQFTLDCSFTLYGSHVYAIWIDPKTSHKTLLLQNQRPDDISEKRWSQQFLFANTALQGKSNFAKLPQFIKEYYGPPFYLINNIIYWGVRRASIGWGASAIVKRWMGLDRQAENPHEIIVKKTWLSENNFNSECKISTLPAIGFALWGVAQKKENVGLLFMPRYEKTLHSHFVEINSKIILFKFFGKRDVLDMLAFFLSAIKKLETIHLEKVIHRDIKSDNVYLHRGEAIIGDFGLAVRANFSGEYHSNNKYNPIPAHYSVPAGEGHYSYATDLYALGLLFKDYYSLLKKTNCIRADVEESVEWLLEIMCRRKSHAFMPSHQFIADYIRNIIYFLEPRELDPERFEKNKKSLMIGLRYQQLFQVELSQINFMLMSSELKAQFSRPDFEKQYLLRSEKTIEKIKIIFNRFQEAEQFIRCNQNPKNKSNLFQDDNKLIKHQIEIYKVLQQVVRQSALFQLDTKAPVHQSEINNLLKKVETILAMPIPSKKTENQGCCTVS